jgi:hypothetical protein
MIPTTTVSQQIGLKALGTVRFSDLDGTEKLDVETSWRRKYLKKDTESVPPDSVFHLVEVDPQAMVRVNPSDPFVTPEKKQPYEKLFREGKVPPAIVIDSGSRGFLLEGRHRTSAAASTGQIRLLAIDLNEK